MSNYTRSGEADELREKLSNCHDYIAELERENKELKVKLEEMHLAFEHNNQVAKEESLRRELGYRDGMIAGLKYAIRCNGVSGGEVS